MQQRHLAHLLEVLLRPRADAGQERLVQQGEAPERVLLGAGGGAGGDRERLLRILSRECLLCLLCWTMYTVDPVCDNPPALHAATSTGVRADRAADVAESEGQGGWACARAVILLSR